MSMGGWKTRSVFERNNITDQRDRLEALAKLEQMQNGHKVGHNPSQAQSEDVATKERAVNRHMWLDLSGARGRN